MSVKTKILNLFLDNHTGDISPADMRSFVNTVFDSQENVIRKVSDHTNMTFIDYPINKNDLVIINEQDNTNKLNGLYISTKDNPVFGDLELVSYDNGTLETLKLGNDNQILATVNGELTWIDKAHGYYIKGTKNITEILSIIPENIGEVFIAGDTQQFVDVPGTIGDGYSWTGSEWINIGQLAGIQGIQGPKGDTGDIGPAGADGTNGLGWTGGSYDVGTGIVTFTSNDGLGFATGDLRGADGADGGTPTGLELITENGDTGWRLVGRNPIDYADIGQDAVDLSFADDGTSGPTGWASFATGYNVKATNFESFAQGMETISSGDASVSTGYLTQATGDYSLAGGMGSVASASYAVALGNYTTAAGLDAFSMGNSTEANGGGSVAFGNNGIANGNYSMVIGDNTIATGASSFAQGVQTLTPYAYQVALGKYNVGTSTTTILEVGVGTNALSRANGLEVHLDGTITAPQAAIAEIDTRGDTSLITKGYLTNYSNDFVSSNITQGGAGSISVNNIVKITQANYDLLTPDADTIYIIIP